MSLTLYHGTSAGNAKAIMQRGFSSSAESKWKVKSKPGFVYLSSAYAPFYAMAAGSDSLALIRVSVKEDDLYPEDDFLMNYLRNKGPTENVYSQEELDKVDLEKHKHLWRASLKFMGNVAVKSDKVRISGVKYFSGERLGMVCDPVISPMNFRVMGAYYKKLSDWIYSGKNISDFPPFGASDLKRLQKLRGRVK